MRVLKGMPLPKPDLDTQPFWDGCQAERFLIPRCGACGTSRWPPGPMCPVCQSQETEWIESTGRGSVYSYVIAVHPVHPVLVEQVPYAVALIDLQEGVRVVGNVLGVAVDEVDIGLPVELFFEQVAGVNLPNFRVATE
jgi:uncharacterized protein